jgi:menaquinol-cytochrome c reductase iron-sulfur subunit
MAETSHATSAKSPAGSPPRRGFLTAALAIVIGGIVGIFPFAAGLAAFFDPLRRSAGGAKKIKITSIEAVPDDGVPRLFPVVADLVDAWTTTPKSRIGAVYLMRKKGSSTVQALNAECPHLGCMVGYTANKQLFQCPCHTSAFDVDGKRRLDISKVPPRNMDGLTCEVKNNEIWVDFQNFYTGLEHQKPKA